MTLPLPEEGAIRLTPKVGGDHVLPFLIESAGVRGRLVRLKAVSSTILKRHDYPATVAGLLADLLLLASGFASLLKYDGIFTLQVKGDGPLKMMVADVTSAGILRGYADGDQAALADLPLAAGRSVPRALGGGYLAFTVDQAGLKERYQGIVEMTGESLSDCLLHYFRQSEQLATMIRMARRDSAEGWEGAALILQRVPSEGGVERGVSEDDPSGDEGFRRVSLLAATLKDDELFDEKLSDQDLLWRLFNEEQVRVFDPRPLSDGCRCSREKIVDVLRQLGKDEVTDMAREEKIEVVCEFCSRAYRFQPDEALALF